MKYFLALLVLGISVVSCQEAEPRRPLEVRTGSFFKETIKRNKELLAKEEKLINGIIAKDTAHSYQISSKGSWYYYDVKNDSVTYTPKPDDLVSFTYNLRSFSNDTIYTSEEMGTIQYKVDKQNLFPGLRNSIKLLKEGETATFLFPSSLGYGYHGDEKKIGTNIPIKSTITLLKIEKQQDSIQN
ncbi:gliding motility-associated peptidyl-prolyl isomerase GldI [Sediminicola arcticus]|jgi:gliding motility-associated peptidyl-prolyl isomerase|uniref:Peptidyl-prolyl cis-trans isomerase n=1 Tax=Sediminicola arcticus TaxID=1574308 RepID=A0ABV2SSV5_9FLAO